MNRIPAGSVGVYAADSRLGRMIGRRQRIYLASREPISHVTIAHGDGMMSESVWPVGVRVVPTDHYGKRPVEWYAPVQPWTAEEARVLRASAAMMAGRVGYDWRGILSLLVRGHNRRGRGLYCSFWVAEAYLTLRDLDFSGCRPPAPQPWNVDLRSLVDNLHDTRDFRRVSPLPLKGAA